MAVFLNNKVGVKVNSVDLSDHVQSVTLNRKFDEISVTAMGDSSVKAVKGLESSSVTIDFLNDTAAANVLATLQAAWGTTVTVVLLQEKGTAVSATNPLYTFSVLVNGTQDINGSVGDIGMQSVTWNCNSTVAVATTGTF
jgi:Flp pilus assembly protein TadG